MEYLELRAERKLGGRAEALTPRARKVAAMNGHAIRYRWVKMRGHA
jgi:hypothetical protein